MVEDILRKLQPSWVHWGAHYTASQKVVAEGLTGERPFHAAPGPDTLPCCSPRPSAAAFRRGPQGAPPPFSAPLPLLLPRPGHCESRRWHFHEGARRQTRGRLGRPRRVPEARWCPQEPGPRVGAGSPRAAAPRTLLLLSCGLRAALSAAAAAAAAALGGRRSRRRQQEWLGSAAHPAKAGAAIHPAKAGAAIGPRALVYEGGGQITVLLWLPVFTTGLRAGALLD